MYVPQLSWNCRRVIKKRSMKLEISKSARTYWSATNSVAILVVTLGLGWQQARMGHETNNIAAEGLKFELQHNTLKRKFAVSSLNVEYRLLEKYFRDGPDDIVEMREYLSNIKPIRKTLEILAECIATKVCVKDKETFGFFCQYTALYEDTVRPWLVDFGRKNEIGNRTYHSLYPDCPGQPSLPFIHESAQ